MMPASYPKVDAERRNRNAPVFAWLDLPADGRKGVTPKLPALRPWSPETLRWWSELWAKPQAVAWDQSGSTAVPMALLYEETQQIEPSKIAGLLAELRAHEDRHGLNPKSMLQLRWRIVVAEQVAAPVAKPKTDRRQRVLKAVSSVEG